jgi:hypothetical protein
METLKLGFAHKNNLICQWMLCSMELNHLDEDRQELYQIIATCDRKFIAYIKYNMMQIFGDTDRLFNFIRAEPKSRPVIKNYDEYVKMMLIGYANENKDIQIFYSLAIEKFKFPMKFLVKTVIKLRGKVSPRYLDRFIFQSCHVILIREMMNPDYNDILKRLECEPKIMRAIYQTRFVKFIFSYTEPEINMKYFTQRTFKLAKLVHMYDVNYLRNTHFTKQISPFLSIYPGNYEYINHESPRWLIEHIFRSHNIKTWCSICEIYLISHTLLCKLFYHIHVPLKYLTRQKHFTLAIHNMVTHNFIWSREHHRKYPILVQKQIFTLLLCNRVLGHLRVPKYIMWMIFQYVCRVYS